MNGISIQPLLSTNLPPGLLFDTVERKLGRSIFDMCEALRHESCLQYTDRVVEKRDEDEGLQYGFRRVSVVGAVGRRWKACLGGSELIERLNACFETLCEIEDFASLSNGQYMPRESRITAITKRWARFAGGLPHEHGEYRDMDGLAVAGEALGRIAEIKHGFIPPGSWELLRTYLWDQDRCREKIAAIEGSLRASKVVRNVDLEVYDPWSNCRKFRSQNWRSKAPQDQITVARTRRYPRNFFLTEGPSQSGDLVGHEITREDARLYLLHLDNHLGVTGRCNAERVGDSFNVKVPKDLPSDWLLSLKAASLGYGDSENCLQFTFDGAGLNLATDLLARCNYKITL